MKFRNQILAFAAVAAFGATQTAIAEPTLEEALDAISYATSDRTVDANFADGATNEILSDDVWTTSASGGFISALVFEFTSNADNIGFGIYDIYDIANTLEVFSGAATSGAGTATLSFGSNSFNTYGSSSDSATFQTVNFGFYIDVAGTYFYSQSGLNSGDTDMMRTFGGTGDIYLDIFGTGTTPGLFSAGEYILGFEDSINGDFDYQDFVVLVESVTPVPAPATLALLGLGLFAAGASRRRKV